jgi:rsbT co-antagonist protein RsbR
MESNKRLDDMLTLYDITDSDIQAIRKMKDEAKNKLPEMVDKWYKWLEQTPEFKIYFADKVTHERVVKLQIKHWEMFFEGPIDQNYFDASARVGHVHARIGLPQDLYLAGMDHFLGLFVEMLLNMDLTPKETNECRRALNKVCHLDMTITVQSYEKVVNDKIRAQSESLISMSTPVTQIWTGLLLLPVVGLIDSKRAQDIMDNTLSKISETHALCLILDISGVAIVDTAVANHLIKISKATRLMGCECIISGLSPAISQTMVELGIDVGSVKTTSNLQSAVKIGFSKLNMRIESVNH